MANNFSESPRFHGLAGTQSETSCQRAGFGTVEALRRAFARALHGRAGEGCTSPPERSPVARAASAAESRGHPRKSRTQKEVCFLSRII